MKELLAEIKSVGYWHVVIRPDSFIPNRINSFSNAEEIVRSSTVRFRGWPYPYFPENGEQVSRHEDYIQGHSDFARYWELWRLYLSGQFVHYLSMREDRIERGELVKMGRGVPSDPNVPVLSIESTLFSITEIYEFGARLAERGVLGELVHVEVSLHGTRGRVLVVTDLRRTGLFYPRAADADEVRWTRLVPRAELLARPDELALEETVKCFEHFHWDDPPLGVLRKDQENFRARRY